MGTLALILAALLAFVCILVVAWPLLRADRTADRIEQLDATERERLALLEARDRSLIALQELETDHREGKVSDDDYRRLVSELRAEAANTLAALDEAKSGESSEDTPA